VAPIAREVTLVQDVLEEHSNDPNQKLLATPLVEAKKHLIDYDWVLTVDRDDNPIGLATVGDALRNRFAVQTPAAPLS